MTHPAFTKESVAVVTGGASGIGQASALKFAAMGMRVVIVDRAADKLEETAAALKRAGAAGIMTSSCDVSKREEIEELEQSIADNFGGTDILMNNAGVGGKSGALGNVEPFERMLQVNLFGAIYGAQVFAPRMIARKRPGTIVNTGSKQGITTPPGNPAYNVSKAALKTYTEALAYELRNTESGNISAHLLIPGFVYTGFISAPEKPASAWTSEQTADFFIERMNAGDFYILCPDNDVSRPIDEKRVAWAAGDIIENRPALSRWHPDYKDAYDAFIKNKLN